MRILLPVFLTAIMAMASAEKSTAMSEPEYTVKGHEKVVVCYWGTWANYRPKDGKFTPEDIDATLCTHLIYSFAGLDAETDAIKPLDPWMDLEEGYALSGYRKATDLKYVYPHLKVKTYSIYSELAKGQLISKANLKFSFEPKTERKYFCVSALANKKGKIKKVA